MVENKDYEIIKIRLIFYSSSSAKTKRVINKTSNSPKKSSKTSST